MTKISFVDYLNRYTTTSSEHEAAFDEFISQSVLPESVQPLRLKTKIEGFLNECFQRDQPASIILTGNAGDGKTYLCRQIIETLTGEELSHWEDHLDWRIERPGFSLRVVKDLSEMDEAAGKAVVIDLAEAFRDENDPTCFLIAANEGRLRAVLSEDARLRDIYDEVDKQLRDGHDLNAKLIVLDLNQVTTSSFVEQALKWMTKHEHWSDFSTCPDPDNCPVHFNVGRLRDSHIVERLRLLYELLEHLDIHVTVRDMLIHLAFTVTGGRSCNEYHNNKDELELHEFVYFQNAWGISADETFRRKCAVLNHLQMLDVGENSIFDLDDLIINGPGDDDQKRDWYDNVFAQELDLAGPIFKQEREAYLHGGRQSYESEKGKYPVIDDWLAHCRRKMFFEWPDTNLVNRLLPFLTVPDYLRATASKSKSELDRLRNELVLGLNRAFSGLYLDNADYLYVTSQYSHAVAHAIPIILFEIASGYIELKSGSLPSTALDRDRQMLWLIIPPPPKAYGAPKLEWPINLLRFEYLVRRANGGTPDILAAECELLIQQLKSDLISRFHRPDEESTEILFFARQGNRYVKRRLLVDNGQISA